MKIERAIRNSGDEIILKASSLSMICIECVGKELIFRKRKTYQRMKKCGLRD